MTYITLTNDWILQKETFEGLIAARLAKKFEWLDAIPKVSLDGAESVAWAVEEYTPDTDPMKRFPRRATAGTEFPRISIARLQENQAALTKYGFEIAISERARRYKTQIDVLMRTIRRAASWMGDWQNAKIIAAITDQTNGVQRLTSEMEFYKRTVAKWGTQNADPIKDMLLLQADFEDTASPGYAATDFYVSKKKFRQMLQALVAMDVDYETRSALYGEPVATATSLYIPLLDATVHGMTSGIEDGAILVLDNSIAPATLYYDFNPEYGPAPAFETEEGETIQNTFGLHTNEYRDGAQRDLIKQIWLENVIAVKDGKGGLFVPNGDYGI
ncbi:MAG TPA: hypothetical protein PK659_10390 [Methanothrix sp.]|nr:hypothetical protein [Methanothrix sp.]HOK59197.1 hypothetical protein [Methanothrix sp.]HOL44651.1 hypothetical protein [Methanothrix sp.]HPO89430.1 hypothetical protein [Methanothrix sp.]